MSRSYYDRPEAERIALTETAMAERRTLTERWAALAEKEASDWSARAALAAEWLALFSSVADFGAGSMQLERYLRPDQTYIPIDVVARDDRTVVCDLNAVPPPKTGAEAAACLGLLEYLFEPIEFLQQLRQHYAAAVISYCITDAPHAPAERRGHAWVNGFSTTEIDNLFLAAGWRIEASQMVDDWQRIWLVRR